MRKRKGVGRLHRPAEMNRGREVAELEPFNRFDCHAAADVQPKAVIAVRLKQFLKGAKSFDKHGQLLCRKSVEKFRNAFGRILQRRPLATHGVADGGLVQVELKYQEIVGMLGFDAILRECLFGEIVKIEGDDDARTRLDGGSQNMPVVLVGKL